MSARSARALLLLLCALLVASWLPLASQLDAQTVTIDGLLPADELARLTEVRRLVGAESEGMLVALVGADEPWAETRVEQLRLALEHVDGVLRVERLPDAALPGAAIEQRMDFLLAQIPHSALALDAAGHLTAEFERLLAGARRPGERTHFAGTPRLRAESWELARRDFERLLPWLVVLVLGIPYLFFRSWRGGLFLLLCAATTTSATLWSIRWMHGSLPAQVLLIVPILWAAAALDALHVLARLASRRAAMAGAGLADTLRELLGPCCTTTATTAIGLALIGARAESSLMRHLGLWAGAGVVLALALTYALAPLCFPPGKLPTRGARWPFGVGACLARMSRRRSGWVVASAALGAALCLALIPGIRLSTSYPQLFAPQLGLSRDMHAIATGLNSDLKPLQMLVRRSEAGDARPVALLRSLLALDQQARTLPELAFVVPDLAALLPDETPAPNARGEWGTGQLDEWLRDSGSGQTRPELNHWFDVEQGWARLDLHFHPMTWTRKQAILDQLAAFDRGMLSNHDLIPWGPGYSTHAIERIGIRDLLEGSLLTCLAMLAILTFAFRDLRLGLLALACSLWPLLVVAAVMAITGRPWSIALLPLPGAVLGIAVDDSIHLLWHRKGQRPRGSPGRLAALPAILASTALVSLAALALGWTSIQANRDFGILMATGMAAALAIDLTVLPALATWLRRRGTRPAR